MCGENLPLSAYCDRFGALAVLSPIRTSPDTVSRPAGDDAEAFSGSISFFNEDNHDCEIATHMRFSPTGTLDTAKHRCLFVNIHALGDLSAVPAERDAVSGSISLWPDASDRDPAAAVVMQNGTILRRLQKPLYLHVGDDRHGNKGIIGRRVTVCCAPSPEAQSPAVAVAEGIVGYNSIPQNPLPL